MAKAQRRRSLYTAEYWGRLKAEFESLTYENAGAYSSIRELHNKRPLTEQPRTDTERQREAAMRGGTAP